MADVHDVVGVMDEKQLIELFHDIVADFGIAAVERIADTAYYFIDDVYEWRDVETNRISDDEDARQVDDARRAREYEIDNRKPY